MEDDVMELALKLLVYEADEPHWDEHSPYYPPWTAAKVEEWILRNHDGDCVKQPQSCMRCSAEHVLHKAKWLLVGQR